MSNNIVDCTVYQQVAPAPNLLQQTGAFVSQGGTTLTAGTYSLLTQLSDLTSLLKTPLTITSIVWASNVVTVTTAAAHTIPAGDTVLGTISGATPTGYDGTFACTYVSTTSFTYPLTTNPGTETVAGFFTLNAVNELASMGNTFFGQGAIQAVYVYELGTGTAAQGVTALSAYLASPSLRFYRYLWPVEWDTEPTAPTLAKQYESTTSRVYFHQQTTPATYTNWTSVPIKSMYLTLESPSAPSAEFSGAADFYVQLATSPGSTSLVAPLSFRFVSGVTPYTTLTGPQITTFTAAGLNWIGTGAEGGISNTLIINGQMGDLNPWNYWYGVDWTQIQCDLNLSNYIINGSNNPTNPVYFDQPGINGGQKKLQQTVNNGVSFGMINAGATVTAVPFSTYVAQNPGDYAIGRYAGYAVTIVPKRGFKKIVFTIVASNLPTA